ncbi:MAG: fibronectin type III domain-containing protein, partial [Microbacteriaceae bacterium]|nr:fibronectin type III domain-containing protein [Microbacteriaceae bacterium]
TTTNLPLGNLKADTDYWFRVRGENGGTVGQNIDYMTLNWGQAKVHTLAASVPEAPNSLKASDITSDGFKLAWKAADYNGGKAVTDFTVEVSTDGGKTWRSAKTTASTSVSYTVAGASPGTSYLVRVAAINEVGSSSFLQGSVKTLATVPGAAQNLTISKVSYRTLTLGWSLPISNGGSLITNYKIEFSSNNGGTWTEITHAVTASRSFNVTGLTRDRSYKFRVSAINAVGVGPATESATVTTLVAVPTAPREISVVNITSTSADLSWAEPADNGGATVTYYVVEVSSDKGQTWTQVVKTVASKKSVLLAGFSPGIAYQYRVLALNKVGRGGTQEGSFTTLAVLPKAPTNAKVSNITSSGLTLSWSLPASNGGSPITDYLIEMSSDGGGTWKSVPHAASNNLALVVTGLPAGTKRLFRVSTVTAVGVSEAFSSTQGVTLGN